MYVCMYLCVYVNLYIVCCLFQFEYVRLALLAAISQIWCAGVTHYRYCFVVCQFVCFTVCLPVCVVLLVVSLQKAQRGSGE